jgi:hypothetical protein
VQQSKISKAIKVFLKFMNGSGSIETLNFPNSPPLGCSLQIPRTWMAQAVDPDETADWGEAEAELGDVVLIMWGFLKLVAFIFQFQDVYGHCCGSTAQPNTEFETSCFATSGPMVGEV